MRVSQQRLGVPLDIVDDDRFLCSTAEFAAWAQGRKQLRMAYAYREMRGTTGLLMDSKKPVDGQWNLDYENRKAAKPDLFMPRPLRLSPDAITADVLRLVDARFGDHFGDLEPLGFGVMRWQQ